MFIFCLRHHGYHRLNFLQSDYHHRSNFRHHYTKNVSHHRNCSKSVSHCCNWKCCEKETSCYHD